MVSLYYTLPLIIREKETKNQKEILNGRQEVQDYDNGKYCSIPGTFTQK